MAAAPRRTPRYAAFLITGALLGLVSAVVLVLGQGSGVAHAPRLLAYLATLLASMGALAGGVLAVVIEGRRRR